LSLGQSRDSDFEAWQGGVLSAVDQGVKLARRVQSLRGDTGKGRSEVGNDGL